MSKPSYHFLSTQGNDRLKGTINGGGPLVMVRASAGNIYLRE
jgi:hypothetical protein